MSPIIDKYIKDSNGSPDFNYNKLLVN